MTDQAGNLRNLMQDRQVKVNANAEEGLNNTGKKAPSRVLTVSSGKGGVGKSNFTVNLALALSKRGKKCVIIDADFGLANIEVLMGIIPKYNFSDVISGGKTIAEIITDGPNGVKFISGGSGFTQLAGLTDEKITYLIDNLSLLDSDFDVILIDTGAGISQQVIDFVTVSSEAVIITTPEPTSITDAYAIIKSIKEKEGPNPKFNIVVNRVESKKEGEEIFQKLERVCTRFLNVEINNLGSLPYDPNLVKAVKAQKPVGILYPNSPVVRSIDGIGDILLNNSYIVPDAAVSGVKSFMKRLISVFKQ